MYLTYGGHLPCISTSMLGKLLDGDHLFDTSTSYSQSHRAQFCCALRLFGGFVYTENVGPTVGASNLVVWGRAQEYCLSKCFQGLLALC